jgi:hypothetical protein
MPWIGIADTARIRIVIADALITDTVVADAIIAIASCHG